MGIGEFVGAPNFVARLAFLSAVKRIVPGCLAALKVIAEGPQSDDALKKWALRYGFAGNDWLLTVARNTVEQWAAAGDPHLPFDWSYRDGCGQGYYLRDESIQWDARWETEAAFRSRVAAYIQKVKALEGAAGLGPAPEKRFGPRDFEWTALYQVEGLTLAAIAEKYIDPSDEDRVTDPSTIKRAVDDVAAMIGLAFRSARGRRTLH